jgi:hypothetical protein
MVIAVKDTLSAAMGTANVKHGGVFHEHVDTRRREFTQVRIVPDDRIGQALAEHSVHFAGVTLDASTPTELTKPSKDGTIGHTYPMSKHSLCFIVGNIRERPLPAGFVHKIIHADICG